MRRAALLYGLLAGIVFAPFLLTGQVFVPGDFLSFIYPWRAYQSGFPHNVELFDVAVFFFPQDIFLNESLKNGGILIFLVVTPRSPAVNQVFCTRPESR